MQPSFRCFQVYPGCGSVGFPTPSGLNPLGSPLGRTPRPVFLDGRCDPGPLLSYSRVAPVSFEEVLPFRATPVCNRPVSGSFHPPSGVLFSFPSRYVVRYRSRDVFRLGGRCPPASRGISDPRYSGIFAHSPPGLRLRGYHPLRRAFPGHFGFPGETAAKPYNTTSP